MTNIDNESIILEKLTAKAKAFSVKFYGIEWEEYLSEAWLAYDAAKQKRVSNSAALTRAEYALKDLQRDWIATERGQVILSGSYADEVYEALPVVSTKRYRTRLPRKLKTLMKKLTKKEQRVLYLSYMWNRTPSEIASDMSLKENTVVSIKYDSLKKLRSWYETGYSEKPKRKEREPFKKFRDLISPEGKVCTIDTTLKKFCDIHNLDPKLMSAMLNGRNAKTHRGWKVLES